MKQKQKPFVMTEEFLPSEKLKRIIYQSDTMKIITDKPFSDKDEFGFLRNDLPDYAK